MAALRFKGPDFDIILGTTTIPTRKHSFIYVQEGVNITPLAYLRDEAMVAKFAEILAIIEKCCNGRPLK